MVISKEHKDIIIRCDGREIKQVNQFKYLGAIVTEKAECRTEIKAKLGQGRSLIKKVTKNMEK